jgi:PD-(D/E)XK nuclease superfamily
MTDQPINLSWSQLRVAEECKQKLHLIRSGHRSGISNIRNFFHGMVVDRCMVTWLRDPNRQPGQMVTMVEDAITVGEREATDQGDGVVRWKHADDREQLHQFCTELLTRLEPILYRHVLPYPFHVAFGFKVPVKMPYLDGQPALVHLIGEMDLLIEHPNGHVIWDLKGTKDDSYWRKVIGQLVFYDLAVYAMHGQPSNYAGLIQPMCTQPVVGMTITDDQRRQMWARVAALATTIWSQDTTCKTSTAGCEWCEVRHACIRYRPGTLSANLCIAARDNR